MTDTQNTGAPAPASAEQPHHGRFRRMLRWMRDYDSPHARKHYITFGVWSSRAYAVLVVLMVALVSYLEPRYPPETLTWVTLLWCVIWTNLYYWYQGKEIIAYPVIQEDNANTDLFNSVIPAVSVGVLVVVFFLVWFFSAVGWMSFAFRYTEYGWIIIGNAAWNILYDLRVNTKVTFILSKVPGRQDYAAPQPPQSH